MWKAYYQQFGQWVQMNFSQVSVQPYTGGIISAKGSDVVGQFTFQGKFISAGAIKECKILKQYIGAHQIFYKGTMSNDQTELLGFWGFQENGQDGGFKMIKQ